MTNENILFEDVKVHSDKLDQDIPLQVYDRGDGIKIISARSLIRFFDSIKEQFGITVTKTVGSISYDNAGLPVHCLAFVTLKDNAGFDGTFPGESSPRTRQNPVASIYPYVTADNRALAKAIRHYLQLPESYYNSDEIPVDTEDSQAAATAVKDIIAKKAEEVKAAKAEEPKAEEAPIDGVIEAAANAIPVEDEIEPTPEEMAAEAGKADKADKKAEEPKTKAPEEKKEPAAKEPVTEEPKTEEPKPEKENVVKEYNGSLVCTFGAGKGKTVDEILNDPACASFVEKIKSGKVIPPEGDAEKAAVIKAIMAA